MTAGPPTWPRGPGAAASSGGGGPPAEAEPKSNSVAGACPPRGSSHKPSRGAPEASGRSGPRAAELTAPPRPRSGRGPGQAASDVVRSQGPSPAGAVACATHARVLPRVTVSSATRPGPKRGAGSAAGVKPRPRIRVRPFTGAESESGEAALTSGGAAAPPRPPSGPPVVSLAGPRPESA